MNFKIGDKVVSLRNGQDTDQLGMVMEITDTEIVVCPLDFPAFFHYNLEGKHEEDTRFSIRKVDNGLN